MSTQFTDVDAILARILSEPTWAHRMLHATARHLDEQPFLTLTPSLVADALDAAHEQILAGLPEVVADEAAQRTVAALPTEHAGETAGEYALRVRAAARSV